MKIVDASVGFKWLVPEQDSDKAIALLSEDLHAPDFFSVELTNALHIAEVRGRILDSQVLLVDLLANLPTLHLAEPLLPRALEIATNARRSVYDALYVALAERERCELVTADQKLFNAVVKDFRFIVDLSSL